MLNFLKKNKKEYWSMTEGVFNCLIDEDRTLAFKKAIEETVKDGDIVVDMGSGTGILSMIAAKCGAKKVYAIEFDEKNIKKLEENFKLNNLSDKIDVIYGDVTKIILPEKADVIIGEMIATGLIEELQLPAMNNILKYSKPSVKVVLEKYKSYVDLVYNNNEYYDLKFDIVRYEYGDEEKTHSKSLSEKFNYLEIDFRKIDNNDIVDFSQDISINRDGKINGLRISTETIFSNGDIFTDSFAYSYPIILPVDELDVKVGDVFTVHMKYDICGGFSSLNYYITKK